MLNEHLIRLCAIANLIYSLCAGACPFEALAPAKKSRAVAQEEERHIVTPEPLVRNRDRAPYVEEMPEAGIVIEDGGKFKNLAKLKKLGPTDFVYVIVQVPGHPKFMVLSPEIPTETNTVFDSAKQKSKYAEGSYLIATHPSLLQKALNHAKQKKQLSGDGLANAVVDEGKLLILAAGGFQIANGEFSKLHNQANTAHGDATHLMYAAAHLEKLGLTPVSSDKLKTQMIDVSQRLSDRHFRSRQYAKYANTIAARSDLSQVQSWLLELHAFLYNYKTKGNYPYRSQKVPGYIDEMESSGSSPGAFERSTILDRLQTEGPAIATMTMWRRVSSTSQTPTPEEFQRGILRHLTEQGVNIPASLERPLPSLLPDLSKFEDNYDALVGAFQAVHSLSSDPYQISAANKQLIDANVTYKDILPSFLECMPGIIAARSSDDAKLIEYRIGELHNRMNRGRYSYQDILDAVSTWQRLQTASP